MHGWHYKRRQNCRINSVKKSSWLKGALFLKTIPPSFASYTVIGFYGGLLLFIIGFIMSFFKSEEKDAEDTIKKEENKK